MCEQLGKEPVESEIPVDINDFPELVQQVFIIYFTLPDIWEGMSGSYLGKNMNSIFDLFNLYEIDQKDRILALSLMRMMDGERSGIIAQKRKQQESLNKAKKSR